MFDYIKATYKKGDKLKLTCVNGEFSGEILFISADSIILKTFDGKTCGIKGSDISFFEEIISSMEVPTESFPTAVVENEKAKLGQEPTQQENEPIIEESLRNDDEPSKEIDSDSNPGKEKITESEQNPPTKSGEQLFEVEKPQLKVVGKIDLDAINQRTRPIKNTPKKGKEKPKQIFTSFESLRSLVSEEHKAQNEKYVPALGEIKFAKPESQFGFIRDGKTGKEYYFSFNQIVDGGIDKSSGMLFHMPVVYSVQGNDRGDMAITIHRPNKIYELINLAQELATKGEVKHAIRVLEHVLNEYPDNFSADELKRKLSKSLTQSTLKIYPNLYSQAKKYNLAKDYPKAIEYFIKAIEAGEKLESSIKDLGMLYAQLYKKGGENAETYRDKLIELMDEHEKDLPNSNSTLYYLENLYYSIQDYESFIDVANELLNRKELLKDKARSSQLLSKIAVAYVQIDDIETAIIKVDEALSVDTHNVAAIKLKSAIESNENKDDIIEAFSATQFESLTSGLSQFIQQTLENYDEYAGVPGKVIESRDFNETTLKSIRGLIEKFSGRSRDRVKYLLTEAKLMQDIEPENTLRLRSILARYCNDMAKIHITDNSSLDVIRFFYNEAFALEENYDNNGINVAYYILTHIYDYSKLLQVTGRNVSVDYAFKQAIIGEFDIKRWINILTMFLFNRAISAKLTSLFYSNSNYRIESIKALRNFGVKINDNPSKEDFTEAWNVARETLKRYNNSIVARIRSIADASNLDEIYQQLKSLSEIKREWMFALDINRLYTIMNNIVPAVGSYIKSSGYRNKEANRNNTNGQINQLIEDIKREPTKLSFEEFLPLLEAISLHLSNSFKDVVKMSEPRLNIKLLSEQTVINDDRNVTIQIEVSNHKDSSPIKEVSISITEDEDIHLLKKGDILYNAIEGGESHIFKLVFAVSDEIINQKATPVTVVCDYTNGNEVKQVSALLSLKLYSQEDFKPIDNPYAPIADGGPVPIDSNMFFGRETDIKKYVDAITKSPSKQIIIFGQKRSGKSSVMYRLKKSLLDTGKTFCVLFSLGDIIKNLTEASFYYKILSSIRQELEFLEIEGVDIIPNFEIPTAKAFKEEDEDNPLNSFTKYMIKFKLACKQTKGWEDKNLVVMIDEFTYLYTEIKKGNISDSIMKQWKAITQNERAQFSVVLVGQDVVPSFKKEDYARNAFGVIEDMRLTYLKEEPARALIETPILDEEGHSRYIGEAVSRIIEYTSRNPYYIQIFCSRLVDFMNKNKSISVTEADVNEVARSFIYGSDALEEDKFDNLIRAGESEDLQEHSEADILAVLRQIALNSKNIGYCNRADIDALEDKEKEDAIIKDLYDREVLDMKGEDNYKIQVKLFQEWLLNH